MNGSSSVSFPSSARFEQHVVYCRETKNSRRVEEIQSTFSSLEEYRTKFYFPLLEEAKQDLNAAYENSLGLYDR